MAELSNLNLRHEARSLGIPLRQIQTVAELLEDGNTVPFIARYRKDQTEGLDEVQLRKIQARLEKLQTLNERKQTILRSIESQGLLTDALRDKIENAQTSKRLEDIYLPYKPKKQTLATTARQKGLESLADLILTSDGSVTMEALAAPFVSEEKGVADVQEAIAGAGYIIAEKFSENIDLRQSLRDILQRSGKIVCSKMENVSSDQVEAFLAKEEAVAAGTATVETTVSDPDNTVEEVTETVEVDEQSAAEPVEEDSVVEEMAQVEDSTEESTEAKENTDGAQEEVGPAGDEGEEGPAAPVGDSKAVAEPVVTEPAVAAESVAEPVAEPVATEPVAVAEPVAEPVAETAASEEDVTAEDIDRAFAVAKSALANKDQVVVSKRALKRQRQAEAHAKAIAEGRIPEGTPLPKPARKKTKKTQKKVLMDQKRQKAFMDYFAFQEEIRKIPPHRILALNRGERAKVLRVKVDYDNVAVTSKAEELCVTPNHPFTDFLKSCLDDSLNRLTMPSLEREVRRELTERAENHAVDVFAKNLRNLLLQPPVRELKVLAVDPGFKSGCKLVALDQFGNVIDRGIVYLIGKGAKSEQSKKTVVDLVKKYNLNVVAIGNGTACRETEEFFADLIANVPEMKDVSYVIVNEAGASVYSASPLGREEFPEYDATVRGAISIGRRLQDPLSELVKIDPANIGVGLYQHDIKTKNLKESLDGVVESCVNFVGVDLNLASPSLLRFVSGLNQLTAKRIYEYRKENGPFKNRQQLLSVSGLGDQTFVQAAGFLKIPHGSDPLDATWIHPESYEATRKVLAKLNFEESALNDKSKSAELEQAIAQLDIPQTAQELAIGELTLKDILAQLVRPGRDPRETLPPPVFKQGILKLEDLEPGMNLKGTVLNVVDFGAFIDIGMYDSGLVHVSEMADKFVRDPHEVVSVGDIVDAWVVGVDKERRRVSLTLIDPAKPKEVPAPRPEGERRERRPRSQGEQGAGKSEGSRREPRERSDRGGDRPDRGGDRRERREGGERRDRRDSSDRRDRETGDSRRQWMGRTREFISKNPPANPKPALTENQKKGKEPMRSFGDLAELFKLKKDEK